MKQIFTIANIAVSHSNFDELCKRIRDFRRSLADLTCDTKSEGQYQIRIQAVPLPKLEEFTQI